MQNWLGSCIFSDLQLQREWNCFTGNILFTLQVKNTARPKLRWICSLRWGLLWWKVFPFREKTWAPQACAFGVERSSQGCVTCMTPCLQVVFDNWAFFIAPSTQKISADWSVLGCFFFFLWQHSAAGLWVGRILTHPWSSSVIAFDAVVVCTSALQHHICYSDTGVFCWSAEQLRVLK